MKKLTRLQKNILEFLQGDLPLKENPYENIAVKNMVSEDTIIKQIKVLKEEGYIRRFAAILNHNKVGLKSNCMCVWKVPDKHVAKIAGISAKMPQISHCYLRKTTRKWPYNFYTMIHGDSKEACLGVIEYIVKKSGVEQYRMLYTQKEFKKISPVYRV